MNTEAHNINSILDSNYNQQRPRRMATASTKVFSIYELVEKITADLQDPRQLFTLRRVSKMVKNVLETSIPAREKLQIELPDLFTSQLPLYPKYVFTSIWAVRTRKNPYSATIYVDMCDCSDLDILPPISATWRELLVGSDKTRFVTLCAAASGVAAPKLRSERGITLGQMFDHYCGFMAGVSPSMTYGDDFFCVHVDAEGNSNDA